jgi:hypothetical protein
MSCSSSRNQKEAKMRFILALIASLLFADSAYAVDYTKNIITDFGAVCAPRAVTADIAISTFTATNHGMPNGRAIHFHTTGHLPIVMTDKQVYYTHNVKTNTFQIKTTAAGTSPISLSGAQDGTHTFDTDDRVAFESFNTWAKNVTSDTNTITLELPTNGDCVFMTGSVTMPNNRIGWGLKQLVINGNNSILESYNDANFGAMFHIGGGGVYQDNVHAARLNFVAKGSTTISVMDPTRLTPGGFTVGRYILIAGLDMMAYGFPQNPYYFEYAKILAVDTSTGDITIDHPTRHFYKTTWPHYSDGSTVAPNQGGYAIAYTMQLEWDTDLTYNDLKIRQYFPPINNAAGTATIGRKITLNNIIVLDGGTVTTGGVPKSIDDCVFATIGKEITFNSVNMDSCPSAEADKITETWTIANSTVGGVLFQSASFNVVNVVNSKIGSIGGTPQIINISSGSVIGGSTPFGTGSGLIMGSQFYGRSEQANCSDSTIYAISQSGAQDDMLPEATRGFSLTNGVLSYPKSKGPVRWAVPDTNLFWQGVIYGTPDYVAQAFHIIDVWDDANYTYVQTDLTRTGFPTPASQDFLRIKVHPAPSVTFTNCVGSETAIELSKAPGGMPLYSYMNHTTTADKMYTSGSQFIQFWGRITELTATVVDPYTGPNATFSVNPFGIGGMNFNDASGTVKNFNPVLNGKVAGLRNFLPLPMTTQAGDTHVSTTLTEPIYSMLGSRVQTSIMSQTMRPIVTVEGVADQNIMKPGN